MGKVKGILAIRTCEGFRDSTKDIWVFEPLPTLPGCAYDGVHNQVTCWFTGLANQGIAAMVLMQISKPRDYNRGANADQGTGRLTGLANQEITAMVLMQIRGWLAYWISKPRNYSNGANTDQVADWLTGLANQEITAMVLMQTRWLVGLLD
ncbi:hypothetical protein VNO77_39161 [Canavalia gladiata]|uniref:Uncharacterized protein n=1 Tax=Canavalia gladiata TaxID=3824 RepID=A0AAN9PY05_CANGL